MSCTESKELELLLRKIIIGFIRMKLSKQIQLILTEKRHVGTHIFAFLRVILDYIVEKEPDECKDLKIPLVYFAEKFLSYYWIMYLNKTQQLYSNKFRLIFYVHLEKIIEALNLENIKVSFSEDKHIHTMWEQIRKNERLERKIINAINGTRIIIFDRPVVHSKYIWLKENKLTLDFFDYPKRRPVIIKAENYKELYENESTFVSIKKKYIQEFKLMYYWFENAVLLAWAQFTDERPPNKSIEKPTGLSLLQIPNPDRNHLKYYRQHFTRMGVKTCSYCNKKKFNAIDHIIPWRMVKNDQFWNMLPICRSCNSKKSDRIWDIGSEGKKILKKSIGTIVDNIQDQPDFLNQVKRHFLYTGQKQNFKDKGALKRELYQITISRVKDFSDLR